MYTSSDADARRPVILYIIVAIVLFAALILGIRWAKSRSAFYAQQQTGQSQPAENQGGQQTETNPSTQEPEQSPAAPENNNASQPSPSAPDQAAVPSRVPSTGPEQFIMPIIALSMVTFAGASYWQARRKLHAYLRVS